VWQRPLPGAVHTYSEFLLTHYPYATEIRLTGNVATLSRELPQQLPRHPQGTAFIDDICALADMLTCLLAASAIGLRLCVASQATCPRFHVDRLGCRLITTYHGPATEWLDNQDVNRDKLGRGANGKADSESGLYTAAAAVQSMAAGEVALLKGESWPGNEGRGIVHRSPPLPAKQKRLFLTMDAIS
tara:strand:- start:243 stop:803 length:561 start_codon:yes stop_codon:yes gene_type:complete